LSPDWVEKALNWRPLVLRPPFRIILLTSPGARPRWRISEVFILKSIHTSIPHSSPSPPPPPPPPRRDLRDEISITFSLRFLCVARTLSRSSQIPNQGSPSRPLFSSSMANPARSRFFCFPELPQCAQKTRSALFFNTILTPFSNGLIIGELKQVVFFTSTPAFFPS